MGAVADDLSCPVCHAPTVQKSGAGGTLTRLHWQLNPGLALNELVFGQTIPKDLFVCEACAVPLLDRTYLWCPTCRVLKPNRRWASAGRFGHWYGWVCPDCGEPTPRLWNYWSSGIRAVTWPLWRPLAPMLRPRLIAWERRRMARPAKPPVTEQAYAKRPVVLIGILAFGLPMFVIFAAIMWLSSLGLRRIGAQDPFPKSSYETLFLFCVVAGAAWGFLMKVWVRRTMFKRGGSK